MKQILFSLITICFLSGFRDLPQPQKWGLPKWGKAIPLQNNEGLLEFAPDAGGPWKVYFLHSRQHSFAPSSAVLEQEASPGQWVRLESQNFIVKKPSAPFSLFQGLSVEKWEIQQSLTSQGKPLRLHLTKKSDGTGSFFNQIITVDPAAAEKNHRLQYGSLTLKTAGEFKTTLDFSNQETAQEEKSLTDPILHSLDHELSWAKLSSIAYPLDFQKILLAGIADPDPGFAYQNGHWFVTVNSPELGAPHEEDRWFVPALIIGNELWQPAPLTAKTEFIVGTSGHRLPQFQIKWKVKNFTVIQTLSSQKINDLPQITAKFTILGPITNKVRLALVAGRRPGPRFFGITGNQNPPPVETTPLPYYSLAPALAPLNANAVLDVWGNVVLYSSEPMRLAHQGETEALIEIGSLRKTSQSATVYIATPQKLTPKADFPFNAMHKTSFSQAQQNFENLWNKELSQGAQVSLPSQEWHKRIDQWLYQLSAITRVNGRLNYGAYLYKMYFGVEEGWPVVALAQWGRIDEAKIQAEFMLDMAIKDRKIYHHQYRNGLSSWYAAEVARLANDASWVEKISAQLSQNAQWTIYARRQGNKSASTQGLLPRNTYGGDVQTPAYSLYANATCWRGLVETAHAFAQMGISSQAKRLYQEAQDYKTRLQEVFQETLDQSASPPFLPLALELGVAKENEKPYVILNQDPLGNYWNLFAPLTLHTGLLHPRDPKLSSYWLTDYMEKHGGLWAGLARFYQGLDAVYSIGYIHELLERAQDNLGDRNKALASLQSFMINAASGNGYTIAEVTALFPYRKSKDLYERMVLESPWTFGFFHGDQYLQGMAQITEPLGAGAGEGLWLMRKAMIDATRDRDKAPDGGLFLLCAAPENWLDENEVIELGHMPTAYGLANVRIESRLSSKKEIRFSFSLENPTPVGLKKVFLRLANSMKLTPIAAPYSGNKKRDMLTLEFEFSGNLDTTIHFE